MEFMGYDQRSKVASGRAIVLWHHSGVLLSAESVGVWSQLLPGFMIFIVFFFLLFLFYKRESLFYCLLLCKEQVENSYDRD
jgi:hypothetical protein